MGILHENVEMQNAIMRVMTRIFSAKVVLERLPDVHKDVAIKQVNSDSNEVNCDATIAMQNVKDENFEQFSGICARENAIEEKKVVQADETNGDSCPVRKPRSRNGLIWKKFKKYCLKCRATSKGLPSHQNCRKCGRRLLFKCNRCKSALKTYPGIRQHLFAKCDNHQANYYQCPDCNYESIYKCNVKNHVKKLHSEERISHIKIINHPNYQRNSQKIPFKCSICQQEFQVNTHFINHCKFYCFKSKAVLDNSNEIEPAVKEESSKCGITFENKSTLSTQSKDCNETKEFSCHVKSCSFKTNTRSGLRAHEDRHILKENSDCPKCGKTFKNQVSMKNHLFSCGKPPAFFCDNCSHVAKQKRDLQTHMLRIHLRDINNDYEVCPKCGVPFKNKRFNKGHLKLCGTSKPHFKCKLCYYMTENKCGLDAHMGNIHLKKN